MLHGIGTDITSIARMRLALSRNGAPFAEEILADSEWAAFNAARDPACFLAKAFAAKEAFAKAYGTGLRTPVTLAAIAVDYGASGAPAYAFDAAVTELMQRQCLYAHLTLSRAKDSVIAVAMIATLDPPLLRPMAQDLTLEARR